MERINSPRLDDDSIEQEIRRKGLTAPRITPQDIAENIEGEFYFTAANGVAGSGDSHLMLSPAAAGLELITFCVLTTRCGFKAIGKSAVVSPENFDAEVGRKVAKQDAINQLWAPMGYALMERLYFKRQA